MIDALLAVAWMNLFTDTLLATCFLLRYWRWRKERQ